MLNGSLRRGAALVTTGLAGAALTLGGLVAVAPSASAAPADPAPAQRGAAWLAGEPAGGLVSSQYGGPDGGLTIDVALALAAVGGNGPAVQSIADGMAGLVDAGGYVSGEEYGDAGSTYAGAVAKTVVLAQAARRDISTYGGEDFLVRLEQVTNDEGRITDVSTYGDYANTLGQSFAARALYDGGSEEHTIARDFLLAQQCEEGFFRTDLGATIAADCDADPAAAPSTDTTALAVLNLLSQRTNDTVAPALEQASRWLLAAQRPDGSFGSDADIPTGNANSTGLAGWALGELGHADAAAKAAVWLRARQVVNPVGQRVYLPDLGGAVAYDAADLTLAQSGPIEPVDRDRYRRASVQAAPALRYAPDGVSRVAQAPTRFLRAGSTQQVTGSAAPGDVVGVRTAKPTVTHAGATGSFRVRITLPSKTGMVRYQVADSDGVLGTVTYRVLGKATVKVVAPTSVKRGTRVVLKARGLVNGEQATFVVGGKKVGKAVVRKGVAKLRVKVKAKPGRVKVRVNGAFANLRHGAATVRVTR
ncbi:hypothetical protein [Nocardioides sp. GXZ039]|uniref:hypothetical protein n=1 Tax=Nocardioides sp. GXZ039 TaxID=3136018 RepID=UPI0030F44D5E